MEKRHNLMNIIRALTQEAQTNSEISVVDLPVPQNILLSPKLQTPMDSQIEEPADFTTQVDRTEFLRQVILYSRTSSHYLNWISIAGFLEFLRQSESSITPDDANFWLAKMIKDGQCVMASDDDTCFFT